MDSLSKLLIILSTEQANPKSADIDNISTLELLKIVNDEDALVHVAVRKELDWIAKAIDQIYPRMLAGGRLIYVGCGTSGRLGVVDASECPPTYSTSPDQVIGWMAGGDAAIRKAAEGVEDSFEKGDHDMYQFSITEKDTLVGIAASGRTPYVLGAVAHAKKLNALTIGLAFNKGIPLENAVDIMIAPVCGPEVITGSTRMKAGTATKLVLNMLSTGVMIKLGKTLGNLMVDVKASNEKLRARSRRIVKMAMGDKGYLPGSMDLVIMGDNEIDQLMQECHGQLKLSILVCMTGLDVPMAVDLLEKHNNILRSALQDYKRSAVISDVSKNVSLSKAQYLAIDCGGSKMAAVSLDKSGDVVGQAVIPSTNFATTPLSVFISRLQKVAGLACGCSSSSLPDFEAIWIGSAGCDAPESQKQLKRELTTVITVRDAVNIRVTNDVDLLASGLAGKEGVVLIAGTGSIAVRYSVSSERIKRSGGLGYLVGDEGSGWDIGLAAIRHVGTVIDHRCSPSILSNRIISQMSCTDSLQFTERIYSGDEAIRKARIVHLAQAVLASSQEGCAISAEILTRAASQLAQTAKYVARSGDTLVLGGGLLTGASEYQARVIQNLSELGISFDNVIPVENVALSAAKSLV